MNTEQIRLLIVSPNEEFARNLTEKIIVDFNFKCESASSIDAAKETIGLFQNGFFLSIVDMAVEPDISEKIIDFIRDSGIPAVSIIDELDDNLPAHVELKRIIIDYVIKEKHEEHIIFELVKIINRIQRNREVKILVVDDSGVSRTIIRSLLEAQKYHIIEAESGPHALEVIKTHTDIKLVIIDYNMPEMDGFAVISAIRTIYSKDELGIIGISAHGSGILSAKFLKMGANDFIIKPFLNEEFCWRVNQSLEMLDHISFIRKTSNKDHLTDLYNRRYFFEIGQKLFENALRNNFGIVIAMIDIDEFKSINDTFGHDFGDVVIKYVAEVLESRLRKSDIITRFGGDEFCILAINMKSEHAYKIFEEIRMKIAKKQICVMEEVIRTTVSIGITTRLEETLDYAIKEADNLLYKAKSSGRNRVEIK